MFVSVLGQQIGVKRVTLPGGGTTDKSEADDVAAAAVATGRPAQEIMALAVAEARRTSSSV